jgi:hypothetical protein
MHEGLSEFVFDHQSPESRTLDVPPDFEILETIHFFNVRLSTVS